MSKKPQRPLSRKFTAPLFLSKDKNACLRVLEPSDISPAYIKGMNDGEVRQFLSVKERLGHQELLDFVNENNSSADGVLLGFFLDELHCGNVRLHDFDGERICLGLALFDRSVWGHGWGTGMVKTAAHSAKNILGCRYVYAGVEKDNVGSARIFEKTGFSQSVQADGHLIFELDMSPDVVT